MRSKLTEVHPRWKSGQREAIPSLSVTGAGQQALAMLYLQLRVSEMWRVECEAGLPAHLLCGRLPGTNPAAATRQESYSRHSRGQAGSCRRAMVNIDSIGPCCPSSIMKESFCRVGPHPVPSDLARSIPRGKRRALGKWVCLALVCRLIRTVGGRGRAILLFQ